MHEPPEESKIRLQLDRILNSEDFASAPKMRDLLSYIVDATIRGDEQRLKGYSIGIDVFERGSDFDPSADSIVRVQVGRLRRLLQHYYLTHGADNPIRITVPKGAYKALFESLDAVPDGETAIQEPDPQPKAQLGPEIRAETDNPSDFIAPCDPQRSIAKYPETSWTYATIAAALLVLVGLAIVLVKPFGRPNNGISYPAKQLEVVVGIIPIRPSDTSDNEKFASANLTSNLINHLAKIKAISVLPIKASTIDGSLPGDKNTKSHPGLLYTIGGALKRWRNTVDADIEIISKDGKILWASEFLIQTDANPQWAHELSSRIAWELRPQIITIAANILDKKDWKSLSPNQLYPLSTWVPGHSRSAQALERRQLMFAKRAIELDPNFGPAHGAIAAKLAILASSDPTWDTLENAASAANHAVLALELSPDNPDTIFDVGIYYWAKGQITRSHRLFDRAHDLDPNHNRAALLKIVAPFTCQKAPDAIVEKVMQFLETLDVRNPNRWLTKFWLAHLHAYRKEYELARDYVAQANQSYKILDSVFFQAAFELQGGNKDEALQLIEDERHNWPNLDPSYYASVILKRRCKDSPEAADFEKLFEELAIEYATSD